MKRFLALILLITPVISVAEKAEYKKCINSVRTYFFWQAIAECEKNENGVGAGGCFHEISSGKSINDLYKPQDAEHCDVFKQ